MAFLDKYTRSGSFLDQYKKVTRTPIEIRRDGERTVVTPDKQDTQELQLLADPITVGRSQSISSSDFLAQYEPVPKEIPEAVTPERAPEISARRPTLPERASNLVRRLGQATSETFTPPMSLEGASQLLSPQLGRRGLSRLAEESAATLERQVPSLERGIEQVAETTFGQRFPKTAATVGTAAEIIRPLTPSLRPSKLPLALGEVAVGGLLKAGIGRLFGKKGAKDISKVAKESIDGTVDQDLVAQIKKVGDISAGERLTLDQSRIAGIYDKGIEGPYRQTFIKPLEDAIIQHQTQTQALQTQIRGMIKESGLGADKKTMTRFRQFAERKLDAGAATAEESKKFSKLEVGVRKAYDDLRAQINEVYKAVDYPLVEKRDDYITHMREIAALSDIFEGILKIPSKVLSEFAKPKVKSSPFFKPRLDAIPEEHLSDFLTAFDKYADSVSRAIHYTPTISKYRKTARVLREGGIERLSRLMEDQADVLSDTPLSIDELTGMHTSAGRLMLAGTKRFVDNQLGFNIGTALNQVAGTVQLASVPGIGIARAGGAVGINFGKKVGGAIIKHLGNPSYKTFVQTYSRQIQLRSGRSVLQDATERGVGSSLDRLSFAPIQFMDEVVAEATFTEGYKLGIRKGLTHDQAIRMGDDIVARTQAVMNRALKPFILQTKIGRVLAPISSFVFNNYNLVFKDILGSRTQQLTKAEKLASVSRFVGAGIATNIAFNLAGQRSPVGSLDVVPFLGAARYGLSGPFRVASEAAKSIAGTDASKSRARKQLGKTLLFGFLPKRGGRQLQRIITEGRILPGQKKEDKPKGLL